MDEPRAVLVVKGNDTCIYAGYEKNKAAKDFILKLRQLSIDLKNGENNTKIIEVPFEIERSDEELRIKYGDILLLGNNKLCVVFEDMKGSYTRIARLGEWHKDKVEAVFFGQNTEISIETEWGE